MLIESFRTNDAETPQEQMQLVTIPKEQAESRRGAYLRSVIHIPAKTLTDGASWFEHESSAMWINLKAKIPS